MARTRPDPRRVVGLLRVSTDDQSLSPEAQREALRRWCLATGAELVAVHEDLGVSGAAPLDRRPGLMAALDGLREHGAGVLLVARRDRIARDVVLAAMVERLVQRHGAELVSADGAGNGDGPEAGLMRHLLAAFAEYERALIRTRTRAAMQVKRSRGERVGSVPFGHRLGEDGRTLPPDDHEQRVVERVRELRAGRMTIAAIAERLGAEGHRPRGERWHPTSVARIARRAA